MTLRAVDLGEALTDPALLGAGLGDLDSWAGWIGILKGTVCGTAQQRRRRFLSWRGQRSQSTSQAMQRDLGHRWSTQWQVELRAAMLFDHPRTDSGEFGKVGV